MVRADDDQSGADIGVAVAVQEVRDRYAASVHDIAARWEEGLRGLLALVGLAGLAGAPLASERLSGTTQMAVGILLGLVLVAAGAGFVLVMSSAYGSVGLVHAPVTATQRSALEWSVAERGRRRLILGRRLAVGALGLFSVAIVVAWLDPGERTGTQLRIETRQGLVYCGMVLDSPAGSVAVEDAGERRVELPITSLYTIEIVQQCAEVGR